MKLRLIGSKTTYAEFTSLTYDEAREFIKGTENQKVRDRMASIVNGKTVLDVGCGNGMDASRYKSEQYLGVDISKELVNVAKEKYPDHKFLVGEAKCILHKLKEEGNNFDFAICKAVLEHVPSEEEALGIFKSMVDVSSEVLVGWHTPPRGDKTKIIQLRGHFGKIVYQNIFRETLFRLPNIKITKEQIEKYELWHVKKV